MGVLLWAIRLAAARLLRRLSLSPSSSAASRSGEEFTDPVHAVTLDFASGDGNWAPWGPTNVSFNVGSASFAPQDFQDITGVGIFGITYGTSSALADIRNFSANLTVIPEPSTYAMVFGLLVLGGTIVRRKRASSSVSSS